jgi:hypothetical protein
MFQTLQPILRRTFRDERGIAAIEAAILFPVLILAGLGVMDTANMVQQTHRMEAGLAAAGSYLAQGMADADQVRRAQYIAVSGQGVPGAPSSIAGWSASDVTITIRSVDNSGNRFRGEDDVRIAVLRSSISYQGFGLLRRASGRRLEVKAEHEVRLAA